MILSFLRVRQQISDYIAFIENTAAIWKNGEKLLSGTSHQKILPKGYKQEPTLPNTQTVPCVNVLSKSV